MRAFEKAVNPKVMRLLAFFSHNRSVRCEEAFEGLLEGNWDLFLITDARLIVLNSGPGVFCQVRETTFLHNFWLLLKTKDCVIQIAHFAKSNIIVCVNGNLQNKQINESGKNKSKNVADSSNEALKVFLQQQE